MEKQVTVIGELMNNSYGRARKSWKARDVEGYQNLAKLQSDLGADYLTLNTDGTQTLSVTLDEAIEFLPKLVPAIQQVSRVPISFDNPHLDFHVAALEHFDRTLSDGRPILNSVSVSRHDTAGMIDLVVKHDMNIIVMASECERGDGGHGSCETVDDVLGVTRHFVKILNAEGIGNDRIIVDPGLAPIASDTQGLVNLCLDSIRAMRADPLLEGIHISVGLSNFAIGTPKHMRIPLERAFLTLATEAGMDWALSNPEKNTIPLPSDDELVQKLKGILAEGRQQDGESMEDAGFRQLDELMELWGDEDE